MMKKIDKQELRGGCIMDKKMVCGILLTIIGLVFSAFCFITAVQNPWNYNGIDGLLGAFLGTNTLIPFVISFGVMILGLVICFWRALKGDK